MTRKNNSEIIMVDVGELPAKRRIEILEKYKILLEKEDSPSARFYLGKVNAWLKQPWWKKMLDKIIG